MEFYTIWAEKRLATEQDHREGPFSYDQAVCHRDEILQENCDCVIIALFGNKWYQIEHMDEELFCKPLNDPNAYWDTLTYKGGL